MSSFVREFYDSEMSGTNKKFEYPDEVKEAYNAREKLYYKLTEKLNKDERDLFEKYIDENHIVKDEEIFHAYVSGMRDIVRFAVGAFTEQI